MITSITKKLKVYDLFNYPLLHFNYSLYISLQTRTYL